MIQNVTPGSPEQVTVNEDTFLTPLMRLAACLLLAVAVAACHSALEPDTPPAFTGDIVARDVTISFGQPPTIHVKESPDEECGVIFLVGPTTRILRRSPDGKVTRASVSDLTVGRRVGVWAGVVLTSCPGQSTAQVVEILEAVGT